MERARRAGCNNTGGNCDESNSITVPVPSCGDASGAQAQRQGEAARAWDGASSWRAGSAGPIEYRQLIAGEPGGMTGMIAQLAGQMD